MEADDYIGRWTGRAGGAERANCHMFLSELCDVIGVKRPDPAGAGREHDDYVFERALPPRDGEGAVLRVDLYKKGCLLLEAKQSRMPGGRGARAGSDGADEPGQPGRRRVGRGWEAMMQRARRQAENYVARLDPDHPAPPFLIVCDVGHALELHADFTGTGRAYTPFPDRDGFRIHLEDLRRAEVRALLKRIWTEPACLDPGRQAARATRDLAARLARIGRSLEAQQPPEEVALFLMRCIFTMFAEGVGLIPRGGFAGLLGDCVGSPAAFVPLVEDLWARMGEPERERRFFSAFRTHVPHVGGRLFRNARAFPLSGTQIGELWQAARATWTEVDPAVFGTLLEQALSAGERRRLGAHYTPRAHVERLVEMTVMEPLRADWHTALTRAEKASEAGRDAWAAVIVRAFHRRLCAVRVLDPACGTGNFLHVALSLMKRLEDEVLETLERLGGTPAADPARKTVDPGQFLGIEVNPRAAAIAELVISIGYLQLHYRRSREHPPEPVLKSCCSINDGCGTGRDAVVDWPGYPVPGVALRGGRRVESVAAPLRPDWPEAEFIVGNPPFMGGKDMRSRLGAVYVEALRRIHPQVNESADLVMYWWDRAAEELARPCSPLRRFGFVTTNSIGQPLQRRVVEHRLDAKEPISLVHAVPDYPWTRTSRGKAAVRIAMTVCEAGRKEGVLWEVTGEAGLDTDGPQIAFRRRTGRINADLSLGADLTRIVPLAANQGLCSRGVQLMGAGFIVQPPEAARLGLGRREGLERHLRPYRSGRDLTARPRGALAIDLFGLSPEAARVRFPEVYQHVLERVKPARDRNSRVTYRDNWWVFGEPRRELRGALAGLTRYIATAETARHRVFQFLDAGILADNTVVAIADDDAATLAVLSSSAHAAWALGAGGRLGYGNDARYAKSRCFDAFPFPVLAEPLRTELRVAGAELDALRKRVLSQHPDLTMTGLYTVLEKLRNGAGLCLREVDIKERGLVLILRELHDAIDRMTSEAYGWNGRPDAQEMLLCLAELNAERAREERSGRTRWLRAAYQAARRPEPAATEAGDVVGIDQRLPQWPSDRREQPLAIEALLLRAGRPMRPQEIARAFRRPDRRREARIRQLLFTLARYGHLTALPDGCYSARRAA